MTYLQCTDCGVIFAQAGTATDCPECGQPAAQPVNLAALGVTPADLGDTRLTVVEPAEPTWAEHYEDTPRGYLYADGCAGDY